MNDRTKNRVRRGIRVTMIGIAVVLLVVSIAVPLINNFIAHGDRKALEALPLPQNTTLVEGLSVAAHVTEGGSGLQYFAAILIESELSLDALQEHYAALEPDDSLTATYRVEPQQGREIQAIETGNYAFKTDAGEGCYVVYTLRNCTDDFLNMDMRG